MMKDKHFLSQWTDISQDLHTARPQRNRKDEDTVQELNLVSILTFKQRNVAA